MKHKRFLRCKALGFAVVFACSSVITTASLTNVDTVYADTVTINGFTIVDGIVKGYSGAKIVLDIPSGVVGIAEEAFKDNTSIETVNIPDTVESIGAYAFSGCKNLKNVNFGTYTQVRLIADGVFRDCSNLSQIDLSNTKLETINNATFRGCESLEECILPDTVKSLGVYAFESCHTLRELTLPEGLTAIGAYALGECRGIVELTLPESLVTIGNSAFNHMENLKSISIPASVTRIPAYAFSGCWKLSEVHLPDSITSIDNGAFSTKNGWDSSHGSLSGIYLPESVKSMDVSVFDEAGTTIGASNRTGLTEITGTADSFAKEYCDKWGKTISYKEISYDATIRFNANSGAVDTASKSGVVGENFGVLPTPVLSGYKFMGWYADSDLTVPVKSTTIIKKSEYTLYAKWQKSDGENTARPEYKGDASDFVISADGVLSRYTGNQSVVVIPEGVKEIASGTFGTYAEVYGNSAGIAAITELYLPDSLTTIGTNAFNGLNSLTKLEIPAGVTEIPAYMCNGIPALREVTLKGNVTKIGKSAFYKCSSLEKINIPDTVKAIESEAFGDTGLVSVDLPDLLGSIGEYAFSDCTALTAIGIPGGVTALGSGAFSGCTNLREILFAGNTALPANVFRECVNLDSVYLPEYMTQIDRNAFGSMGTSSITKKLKIVGQKNLSDGSDTTNAYDVYVSMKNDSSYSKYELSFQNVSPDLTIRFDTGVAGLIVSDKNVKSGTAYGSLPTVSRAGYTLIGWSETQGSNKLVKTTDTASGSRTLYAVWLKDGDTFTPWEEPVTPAPTGTPVYNGKDSQDTEAGYTEISTVQQLLAVNDNLSGNYRLTADLDLSGVDIDGFGWRPIGYEKSDSGEYTADGFTGKFDGNGHTISGLRIEGQTPYAFVGLFGRIYGGTVTDLKLTNVSIKAGYLARSIGALVGIYSYDDSSEINKTGEITGVSVTGTVQFRARTKDDAYAENKAVGGIAGYVDSGVVENCVNNANVGYYSDTMEIFEDKILSDSTTSRYAGGVVGYLGGGTISRCGNGGEVATIRDYYGIFESYEGDTISGILSGVNVYNTAAGICGAAAGAADVTECYNAGKIMAYCDNTYNLFNLTVNSGSHTVAGGIVGIMYESDRVTNSYNRGALYSYSKRNDTLVDKANPEDAANNIWAILDKETVQAPFQNAYGFCGGIIGKDSSNAGSVSYCYNAGPVHGSKDDSGNYYVYGIAYGDVATAYCRYNSESAAGVNITGTSAAESDSTCRPFSTDENAEYYIYARDTYKNFDFDNVWVFNEASKSAPQLQHCRDSLYVAKVEFVNAAPDKTTYEYGEQINLKGLEARITFSDNTTYNYKYTGSKGTDYNPFKAGTQTVSVNLYGTVHRFEVNVRASDNHSYVLKSEEWSDDGKTVTFTFECTENALHRIKQVINTTAAVKTEATCVSKGVTTYSINVDLLDGQHKKESKDIEDIPVNKANHKYTRYEQGGNGWHYVYCENGCGDRKTQDCRSEYTILKEATYQSEGLARYSCGQCGHSYEQTIPVLNCEHNHRGYINAKAPTCAENGYEGDMYCYDCGKVLWQGAAISATGQHTFGESVVVKEPTTTEEGTSSVTCTTCGLTLYETLPKLENTVPSQGNLWYTDTDGCTYWYENGVKQGTEGRGKEIYDPSSNAWYWLDAVSGGQVARNKDVYQESKAGIFGDNKAYLEDGTIDVENTTGKWVRYDANGHMVKGWDQNENGTYYFDLTYGSMAKGYAEIDGKTYYFNEITGILEREGTYVPADYTGWKNIAGADYWYENGVRQGCSDDSNYRGKEIYDPASDAWYWLDNVDGGKKAVSKDVYQESQADDAGNTGKWVRYDSEGHMVKGWNDNGNGSYYFDIIYGTMYKGWHNIDGTDYYFDEITGVRM